MWRIDSIIVCGLYYWLIMILTYGGIGHCVCGIIDIGIDDGSNGRYYYCGIVYLFYYCGLILCIIIVKRPIAGIV